MTIKNNDKVRNWTHAILLQDMVKIGWEFTKNVKNYKKNHFFIGVFETPSNKGNFQATPKYKS